MTLVISLIHFSGCPDEPFLVAVDVTGTHTVTVRFQEPETLDSHVCTKFKGKYDGDIQECFNVTCK